MNKRIITSGLIAGIAMLVTWMVLSRIFGFIFPGLTAQYQNPALFRPWSDPLMSLIFVEPFILGLVLAWLWSKIKEIIKGKDDWGKAFNFGVFYWIIGIPGMFISYSTFPVPLTMIITWSLSGFVQGVVAGWVFAKKLK